MMGRLMPQEVSNISSPKGVSPLTRSWSSATLSKSQVGMSTLRAPRKIEDLTQERMAVNREQKSNHEKKMALQLSTFKIKDPYTDHIWGINANRQPKPFRGYNTTLQRHYHHEDEKAVVASEKTDLALKVQKSKIPKPNQTHNILDGTDRRPGKEGMMPMDEPPAPLSAHQVSERAKSDELKQLVSHDHRLILAMALTQHIDPHTTRLGKIW